MDVVRKDGLILTREMAVEVKNMMDFKMSAVLVSKNIIVLETIRNIRRNFFVGLLVFLN